MTVTPSTDTLNSTATTVPVYDWLVNGRSVGLGTKCEFDHWTSEGVMQDSTLGDVLCFESAAEDERRKLAWAGQ